MLAKSLLANLNTHTFAIEQSNAIQCRVAKVGFNWRDAQEVIQVLRGELSKLEEAIQNNDVKHMHDELGDVLFTCVNLARHLKISIEDAVNTHK